MSPSPDFHRHCGESCSCQISAFVRGHILFIRQTIVYLNLVHYFKRIKSPLSQAILLFATMSCSGYITIETSLKPVHTITPERTLTNGRLAPPTIFIFLRTYATG